MVNLIDAHTVDAIAIEAAATSNCVGASIPDQATLDGFVKLLELHDLDIIVAGVLSRTGFGTNSIDVDYLEGTVEISSPNTTVIVDEPAFDRLIARMLTVAMAQARIRAMPVTKQEWWSVAEAQLDEIVKRAYPSGLPG